MLSLSSFLFSTIFVVVVVVVIDIVVMNVVFFVWMLVMTTLRGDRLYHYPMLW